MLYYNYGKPHYVFSQLLFYCQVYARKTICLFVLSVYVCQNNERNHVTVDTMWYLAQVKNKPVILRHLVDMWFIHLELRPRWINHISPRCLKISLSYSKFRMPISVGCNGRKWTAIFRLKDNWQRKAFVLPNIAETWEDWERVWLFSVCLKNYVQMKDRYVQMKDQLNLRVFTTDRSIWRRKMAKW